MHLIDIIKICSQITTKQSQFPQDNVLYNVVTGGASEYNVATMQAICDYQNMTRLVTIVSNRSAHL
jgi:hypothetical protein